MESNKESLLVGYPNPISYECTKMLLVQMEKCVCKIKIGNTQGTGSFCKIPFPNKKNMLSVLITNNHIINKEILNRKNAKISIDIKEKSDIKELNLNNRKKYTNEEHDITIIEIKENDEIKNYLELDDIITNDILNDNNRNKEFIDKTLYIIQYPESELSVSYGILESIYEDNLSEAALLDCFHKHIISKIRNAINDCILEQEASLRISAHAADRANELDRASVALGKEFNRTPTISELAKYVALSEDEVERILKMSLNALEK